MASNHKAGESGETLATDLRFSFVYCGPSLVQVNGFRVKIITIRFVTSELHQTKKKTKRYRR